jgi:hypothetical protein
VEEEEMATELKAAIAVAVIGLLGALGVAVINNWDKIFRPQKIGSQVQTSTNVSGSPSQETGPTSRESGVPNEASRQTTGDSIPTTSNAMTIEVPARPRNWRLSIFTPTNIHVKPSQKISFMASGLWRVGLGSVGPDGREDWCECVVGEKRGAGSIGALGALIGKIGDNRTPFLIGVQRSVQAVEEGILFLGSNDNMGPCDGINRGSCYQDNSGTLKVRIEKR